MSISPVVTRGYGNWGSITLVPTRGYAQGALGTDADLADLTLSKGTLDPAFAASTTSYTANVGTATSVDVTATLSDTNASFTINGEAGTSGVAKTVSLSPGANTITILVTAEDGSTQKTYTVTVTVAAAAAQPEGPGLGVGTGGGFLVPEEFMVLPPDQVLLRFQSRIEAEPSFLFSQAEINIDPNLDVARFIGEPGTLKSTMGLRIAPRSVIRGRRALLCDWTALAVPMRGGVLAPRAKIVSRGRARYDWNMQIEALLELPAFLKDSDLQDLMLLAEANQDIQERGE